MRLKNTATSNKKKRKVNKQTKRSAVLFLVLICEVSESESEKSRECGEAHKAISTRLDDACFADVFPACSHKLTHSCTAL